MDLGRTFFMYPFYKFTMLPKRYCVTKGLVKKYIVGLSQIVFNKNIHYVCGKPKVVP